MKLDSSGVTLLELLIAIAIIGIIAAVQVGPFSQTIESRDRAEAEMERVTSARITLQRMAEELAGAVAIADPERSFALADDGSDEASELRFPTTGARRLRAGRQDPVEIVRYFIEPGSGRDESARLVKEQLPSVAAEGISPQRAVVVEGVAAFRVRALASANSEWLTSWDPRESGAASLPEAVELALALEDGTSNPQVYRMMLTLPMGGRR